MSHVHKLVANVKDEKLRKRVKRDKLGRDYINRVEWIGADLNKFPNSLCGLDFGPDPCNDNLQQSDLLRNFYMTIAVCGLQYAFNQQIFGPGDLPPGPQPPAGQNADKKVIVVGAGISGLAAGYELKREGYDVEILEMSQRYGGRLKTLDYKDGFDRGLHTDAGGMRLPQPPDADRPIAKMIHYLTDYYAIKKFGVRPVAFSNSNSNAFYYFYGQQTKISEWTDSQFSEYWPGWDERIVETGQTDITDINTYMARTTHCVVGLLEKRLQHVTSDLTEQAEQWDLWTDNWSQFSYNSFLRSNLASIKELLQYDDIITENDTLLNQLGLYLPWPEMAITCYNTFNYMLGPDVSLVAFLQDEMGKWWTSDMHSLEGGLSAISHAFADQGAMEQHITYNRTVQKVEYTHSKLQGKTVKVSGIITSSGRPFEVDGRSVILTVPLHVLRGIDIKNVGRGRAYPREFHQAIEDISYEPSTKIMLQYKEQFWNTGQNPSTDITGGFSKTNLAIGQLHYPTDDQPGAAAKGILMTYTWKAEALLWGALSEEQAIINAVEQIDQLHPNTDTKALFEVGKRQAWTSDPTTLGAFAMLRPGDYNSLMFLMQNSWKNVYFAGEAISFANGWIQGALESGLRAAYELFRDDQPKISPASKC